MLTGRDLTVRCEGEQVLVRDVVVGDVWHASGQSNMAMTVAAVAETTPAGRGGHPGRKAACRSLSAHQRKRISRAAR